MQNREESYLSFSATHLRATVTLSNGVPIETVSKMLGHRSISTTQIYAKVLENKVSEDMTKLKTRLSRDKMKGRESKVG
jgi:site-specific recombinase XerD